MKESIEYYYDISINEIDESNSVYSFLLNDNLYILVEYLRTKEEMTDILKCCEELVQKNIPVHNIIANKNNEFITIIDQKSYCLLKIKNNYKDIIDIININEINNKTILSDEYKNKYKNNWGELWSKKVDYLEYQVSERGLDKNIVLDSFSYYVGLAENAITMVNKLNKKYDNVKGQKICLSHRRIYYPNYNINYYNPLSYLFDLEVRDISEYIKSCYFCGDDSFLEIITFLKSTKLSDYSYQMLYARLLYPSYYFDLYEKIINEEVVEDKLIDIISKVDDYENFLKKIYLELSKYTVIDKVDWLIN